MASSLLPWQVKRSLLNKKLYYKRLNRHVKIGKVKAKWVRLSRKERLKLIVKIIKVYWPMKLKYVIPCRQRGKDPYIHESLLVQ